MSVKCQKLILAGHKNLYNLQHSLAQMTWTPVSAKSSKDILLSLPWKSNSWIWFSHTVWRPFLYNHKKKLYIFLICEFPRRSMTKDFEDQRQRWLSNVKDQFLQVMNISWICKIQKWLESSDFWEIISLTGLVLNIDW